MSNKTNDQGNEVIQTSETNKATPVRPSTFGESFFGTLKHLIEDVTTLEVATYMTYGDQEGDITVEVGDSSYKAVLQAYTKISLDADTIVLLPAKKEAKEEIVIRQELYDIHQQYVRMAKETRQEMVAAMLGAIGSVMNVFGK